MLCRSAQDAHRYHHRPPDRSGKRAGVRLRHSRTGRNRNNELQYPAAAAGCRGRSAVVQECPGIGGDSARANGERRSGPSARATVCDRLQPRSGCNWCVAGRTHFLRARDPGGEYRSGHCQYSGERDPLDPQRTASSRCDVDRLRRRGHCPVRSTRRPSVDRVSVLVHGATVRSKQHRHSVG